MNDKPQPAFWLDRIPLFVLIAGALFLGTAPMLAPTTPEPHLVEKLRMLFNGSLGRPIDIFDLFLHGLFPALLLARLVRMGLGMAPAGGK